MTAVISVICQEMIVMRKDESFQLANSIEIFDTSISQELDAIMGALFCEVLLPHYELHHCQELLKRVDSETLSSPKLLIGDLIDIFG